MARYLSTHVRRMWYILLSCTDINNDIYADDEGLFHTIEGGIIMENWVYPILGNTILIGEDDGDMEDVKTSIEEFTI